MILLLVGFILGALAMYFVIWFLALCGAEMPTSYHG